MPYVWETKSMSEITKKIKIRKPYFGAGSSKVYNWLKDGFHMHGIGVNINYLNNFDALEITLESKTSIISTDTIRKFADKYNSYYDIRNSTARVAVFSITLLDPSLTSRGKKPDDRQQKLF